MPKIIDPTDDIPSAYTDKGGFRRFFNRRHHPPSLSRRLVVVNILVLLVALGVMDMVVYVLVIGRLTTDQDNHLRQQVHSLEHNIQLWTAAGQTFNSTLISQLVQGEATDESTSEPIYIKLLDKDTKQLLARSPNLNQEHLLFNELEYNAARNGQSVLSMQQTSLGRSVRSLTVPLYDANKQVVVVAQVVQSLEVVEKVRLLLVVILVLGSLFATIVAYGIGIFFTRRTLQPLDNFVVSLQSLDEQNLQLRLPPQNSCIEVLLLVKAFNQMVERLEASFNAQRAFVAEVSHELRTPLTAIRGQLDVMLLDPALREVVRNDVTMVNDEVNRLSRLVTNLLTHARAEIGLLEGSKLLIELDSLLLETTRQARFLNQNVELKLGRFEQARIIGDEDLVKQLMLNLIDNALIYTPPGGVVKLEVRCTDQLPEQLKGIATMSNNWAVFTVIDTGPGIDPSDLPHVFERHYRAKTTLKSHKQGAGLGLYIAWLIAQTHNGTITVESEPGKGTEFTVWLPTCV